MMGVEMRTPVVWRVGLLSCDTAFHHYLMLFCLRAGPPPVDATYTYEHQYYIIFLCHIHIIHIIYVVFSVFLLCTCVGTHVPCFVLLYTSF